MIEKIKQAWRGEVKDQKLFGINCIAIEIIFVGICFLLSNLILKYAQHSYTKEETSDLYSFLFSLTLPIQIFMFVSVVRVIRKQKVEYLGKSKRKVSFETLKNLAATGNALWLIPTFYITNSF